MIKANSHKYSVSAMCRVLKIYRRRIARIMKLVGLVSKYTVAKFKPQHDSTNEEKTDNLVEHKFNDQDHLQVVVSDLTYVRVGHAWNYVCVLIDLFNREIIGYSAGRNKDAALVAKAFSTVRVNLGKIKVFHTDRGNEFKNQLIEKTLNAFNIKRSLSMKGSPYDNAVAEASFKTVKTEFIKGKRFDSLEELKYELSDYVNWFNNHRINSSLGYQTPVEYRMNNLKKKLSKKMLPFQLIPECLSQGFRSHPHLELLSAISTFEIPSFPLN